MADSREQERKELNTVHFLGDIREDISFLGLKMHQMLIMALTILFSSLFLFYARLPMPVTLIALLGIVGTLAACFYLRWVYRTKRFYTELYSQESGDGEDIDEYLDVLDEGWLYRNGKLWTVLMKVSPPQTMAWNDSLLRSQMQRLSSFEHFLRMAIGEKVKVDIDREQVPDFQFEAWDQMREREAPSEGVRELRHARLDLFEQAVEENYATTYEYTIALTFSEIDLNAMKRDDEPAGMTKEQAKRYRTIMAIREKMKLLMDCLESSGHTYTTLAGYHMAERIGRFLDYYGWREWKMTGGLWEEQAAEALQLEEDVNEMEEEEDMSDNKRADEEIDRNFASPEAFGAVLSSIEEASERPEDALVESSGVGGAEDEKPVQKRSWGVTGAFKWLFSLRLLPGVLWSEAKRLVQLLMQLRLKRRLQQQAKAIAAAGVPQESHQEALDLPQSQPLHLPRALIVTSSVPSGKSLLTANIALASALNGQPCQIVDLSLHQGTVTVLNTLRHEERTTGWKVWELSRVDGLKIWTPTWNKAHYPSLEQVIKVIDQQMKLGHVLIDMPWNYPDRDALLARYTSVAVVDSDYHHWLQMSKEMKSFTGDIWMNQVPKHLLRPLTQMIRETWKAPITAVFPFFSDASECLLQGTPLAMNEHHQPHFTPHHEQEVTDEDTQTIA